MILCKYGCGKEAKHLINKAKEPCCSSSSQKCSINRAKNSEGLKKAEIKRGRSVYDSMSEESKKRMTWNKGLTKETNATLKNYSENLKKRFQNNETIGIANFWKGKTLSEEHKLKVSKGMRKAVIEGRQKTPMAGKAKSRKVKNILNDEYTLRGSREEKLALFLNENEVLWIPGKRHSYYDCENELRSYFTDFYLPEFGI